MKYRDLRDFIFQLEFRGELDRITHPADPKLEITEIGDRILNQQGPALRFAKPKGAAAPVFLDAILG